MVSSRSRGEMGGEWIRVVKGMITSRSSGGGKKLLNGLNPGEKIVLQAKSSGSCIDGELVLIELARLFCLEFILSVSRGCHRVKDLLMTLVSFSCFGFFFACIETK